MSSLFEARHWQYDSRPFGFYLGVDFGRMMFGLLVKREDGLSVALGVGPFYLGVQR